MLKRSLGGAPDSLKSTDGSGNDNLLKRQRHAAGQRFFVERQSALFRELQTTTHFPSELSHPTKINILEHAITSYKALEALLAAKEKEMKALSVPAVEGSSVEASGGEVPKKLLKVKDMEMQALSAPVAVGPAAEAALSATPKDDLLSLSRSEADLSRMFPFDAISNLDEGDWDLIDSLLPPTDEGLAETMTDDDASAAKPKM